MTSTERLVNAIADRYAFNQAQRDSAMAAVNSAPPSIDIGRGMMAPVDLFGRALRAAGIDPVSVGWTHVEAKPVRR